MHLYPIPARPASAPARSDEGVKAQVVRVLETNRLACEYQPLVRLADGEIWAYEALARFSVDGVPLGPADVFGCLRDDRTLFFMLESRTKRFQIRHRPRGVRLFVNVDPHVCEEDYQLEHWLSVFAGERDLVVEVIENTGVANLDIVRTFTERLGQAGVTVALDDVGGPQSFFSFELLDYCQVLKLDRRWFSRLLEDAAYHALVGGLVAFARARNIQTVLEGVETEADLEVARALGVDLVQGFYFRDQFVTVREGAPPSR